MERVFSYTLGGRELIVITGKIAELFKAVIYEHWKGY